MCPVGLAEPLGWAALRQIMTGLGRLPVARPSLMSWPPKKKKTKEPTGQPNKQL